jgi:ABC-type amino acid transport system permease subunit
VPISPAATLSVEIYRGMPVIIFFYICFFFLWPVEIATLLLPSRITTDITNEMLPSPLKREYLFHIFYIRQITAKKN